MTIDGYEDVPKNDEYALKQAISQQPVAVGICASPAMQFYRCGTYCFLNVSCMQCAVAAASSSGHLRKPSHAVLQVRRT